MTRPKAKELTYVGLYYRNRDNWIRHIIRAPKSRYSHVEKLIAVYIAETNNPEDREWITSQEKIAGDLEIGLRIVKSAVAKLKADGLIEITKKRVGRNSKLFNCYAIVAVEDAVPRE